MAGVPHRGRAGRLLPDCASREFDSDWGDPFVAADDRYLIRGADRHYLGEYVTDRSDWSAGDEFTERQGRRLRIVTIEPSKMPGEIRATWTVEEAD